MNERGRGIPWSDTERRYLIEHYGHDECTAKIARHLGRSVQAIHTQASNMGIAKRRQKPEHLDIRGWVDWTHHEAMRARRRRDHLYCRGCGKVPRPDERWCRWCLECWPNRRKQSKESAA